MTPYGIINLCMAPSHCLNLFDSHEHIDGLVQDCSTSIANIMDWRYCSLVLSHRYFNDILFKLETFSFTKMHLKMSSTKCLPFCFSLNVLNCIFETNKIYITASAAHPEIQELYNYTVKKITKLIQQYKKNLHVSSFKTANWKHDCLDF